MKMLLDSFPSLLRLIFLNELLNNICGILHSCNGLSAFLCHTDAEFRLKSHHNLNLECSFTLEQIQTTTNNNEV